MISVLRAAVCCWTIEIDDVWQNALFSNPSFTLSHRKSFYWYDSYLKIYANGQEKCSHVLYLRCVQWFVIIKLSLRKKRAEIVIFSFIKEIM